jgi:hypothetical protein
VLLHLVTVQDEDIDLLARYEALRKEVRLFDASIAELLAKIDELLHLANKRGEERAEITHYQEKIAKLADDAKAASDPKKQEKAEKNQAK